jgi:hypothetical protein
MRAQDNEIVREDTQIFEKHALFGKKDLFKRQFIGRWLSVRP